MAQSMNREPPKIIRLDEIREDYFRSENSELPVWFKLIVPLEINAQTKTYVQNISRMLNRLFEDPEITPELRKHTRFNGQRFVLSPNNVVLEIGYSSDKTGNAAVKTVMFDLAADPKALAQH